MKEELKEIVLADAIEQYMKAERKIIKLERENGILYAVILFLLIFMLYKLGG